MAKNRTKKQAIAFAMERVGKPVRVEAGYYIMQMEYDEFWERVEWHTSYPMTYAEALIARRRELAAAATLYLICGGPDEANLAAEEGKTPYLCEDLETADLAGENAYFDGGDWRRYIIRR